MAIQKQQFHQRDVGMGDEDWYYLARDTESGRIFVYHEWSHREGERFSGGNEDVELDAFLGQTGTAQSKLRQLIGTLVTE